MISACVITRNEAANIARCLHSLRFCDELLVIDARSTDATREIATNLGARVIERDWPGFRSQREFALQAASHDWILFLDADEELTAAGAEWIRRLRDEGSLARYDGYWLPRHNRYYDRYVLHGDWRSDRGIRLFDRRRARVAGREIHEYIAVDGQVAHLDAVVLHESYADLDQQLTKLSRYAKLMAECWFREGRRASVLACIFNPGWRFIRSYLFRLGMLDGWRGFVIAMAEARYVREKYLRLLVLEKSAAALEKGEWRPSPRRS